MGAKTKVRVVRSIISGTTGKISMLTKTPIKDNLPKCQYITGAVAIVAASVGIRYSSVQAGRQADNLFVSDLIISPIYKSPIVALTDN